MNLQKIELKTAPEVLRVVRAAFPNYKKHNAFLSSFSETTINSYWDGGSKSVYVLVDLATLQHKHMPTSTHPHYEMHNANGENQDVIVERGNITLKRLPEGIALVEGGVFCGKLATAHVHVNPANLSKLLPGVQS